MSDLSNEAGLRRSRFDTRRMPHAAGYEAWNEAINVLFDARSRRTADEGFFASVDATLMGEVALGRLEATAQDFDRSRYKIARDGMDGYVLQFYLKGQSAARDNRLPVAGVGDLYIVDMAQPLATTTSDHQQISLVVPRRLLAPRVGNPDDLHMRVIPSASPLVSLFRDSLMSFDRNIDRMTRLQGEAVIEPLLGLAAAALDGHVREDNAGGVNLAQFSAIRRYVDAHLMERGLSIDTVVSAFALSRRTVYRLFEAVGGFSSYVNRRRLQRAFHILRSGEWRHLSISEIAEGHGFSNPEHFSRAFRREFSLSPREVRHLSGSAEALSVLSSGRPETEWSNWISMLGR
ncbi:helix-turn-helix domain-containing protein [Rhizobium terrae]|uniref:helix-turn-helix domain-containing protein n=1 Tax=Rhizobium terrae TaxID=2171756 RepID=UPI000E3B9DBF|nr:helix-turn-helix domain-containing protein [Rhizobium terrae]